MHQLCQRCNTHHPHSPCPNDNAKMEIRDQRADLIVQLMRTAVEAEIAVHFSQRYCDIDTYTRAQSIARKAWDKVREQLNAVLVKGIV